MRPLKMSQGQAAGGCVFLDPPWAPLSVAVRNRLSVADEVRWFGRRRPLHGTSQRRWVIPATVVQQILSGPSVLAALLICLAYGSNG